MQTAAGPLSKGDFDPSYLVNCSWLWDLGNLSVLLYSECLSKHS